MNESFETTTAPFVSPRHIVVFGRHDYILSNIEKLLQNAGFTATGFLNLEDVMEYLQTNRADGVLIGGGVEPHDRLAVANLVKEQMPQVRIIEHFGGPATIISEVNAAFHASGVQTA